MAKKSIEQLVDDILKIKEVERELKEKRQQLEQQLFESVQKPVDGKPLWIGDDVKIVWRTNAKISQKQARIWFEKNPDLSRRIFSMSFKPKISEISKLERTVVFEPEKLPGWMKDFAKIKEDIEIEEKPALEIVKKEGEEQ
jgi:hypothetical protein